MWSKPFPTLLVLALGASVPSNAIAKHGGGRIRKRAGAAVAARGRAMVRSLPYLGR